MTRDSSIPPASSASESNMHRWAWVLDEAAIRDDGGAGDLAIGVDAEIASQYTYTPPDVAYERVLWEATRAKDIPPFPPEQVAASAGWIVPRSVGTQPVFIAHTMLSAVWLLRQSLSSDAVSDTTWAALAQAACSVELVTESAAIPSNTTGNTPPRPAKRARTASAACTEGASGDASAVQKPVATVSNHNRQAERVRKTKLAKAAGRRMEALGLVEPGSQAPVIERNAHRAIVLHDEPEVAWIVKQPAGLHDFFHTAKLPYATANTMLQCARSVGDETAKTHAAYFVHNWRRSGHPLLLEGTGVSALVQSSVSGATSDKSSFHITMDAISSSESFLAIAGIRYRWGMARLGQRYQEEVERIQAADRAAGLHSNRRDGEGHVRAQAKRAIWDQEKPRMTWSAYNTRVKRSRRWFQAAETLGWGFLLLIPTATVTPNWVEQTLRMAEWDILLRLVERVNPAAVQASRDFDAWVGPAALHDGSIQGAERLWLEQRLESRIQEVPDSDGDSDDDSDSDGGSDADSDVRSRSKSRSPSAYMQVAEHKAVLRSLNLSELFRPVRTGSSAERGAEEP